MAPGGVRGRFEDRVVGLVESGAPDWLPRVGHEKLIFTNGATEGYLMSSYFLWINTLAI